jgi:hypothetical protein
MEDARETESFKLWPDPVKPGEEVVLVYTQQEGLTNYEPNYALAKASPAAR